MNRCASSRKHTVSLQVCEELLQSLPTLKDEWKADCAIEAVSRKLKKSKSFQTCAVSLYNRQQQLQWFKLAFTRSKGDAIVLTMSGEGDLCIPILDEFAEKIDSLAVASKE